MSKTHEEEMVADGSHVEKLSGLCGFANVFNNDELILGHLCRVCVSTSAHHGLWLEGGRLSVL